MDDLVGIGDVAGLAVDTVGRVDLQLGLASVAHHFIHRRGAKILAGIPEFAHAAVPANIRIGDDQVAGLVFIVARAGMIYVGEAIEGELAITLEARGLIDERPRAMKLFVFGVAGLRVQRVRDSAPAGYELQSGIDEAGP